ncbi:hypothetical protein IWQ57_001360 [Coemansia nantahalensis]|uniref:Uncharacterized protein n=1 Tax=Coemansia nantahalensis TaxID=2789366 RepID=A0ACC1K4M1_9FUNG|nr:hypothetical protein IWQ57_001360 [Coemansia nantahalensis]
MSGIISSRPMALAYITEVALRPTTICAVVCAYVVWKVVYALYFSPLRNVPGPFLSRISWLPMRLVEIFGTEPEMMRRHYEKYGSTFVMEPTRVAVCDPGDCTKILSTHAFRKDYYYDRVKFLEPNIFLSSDPDLNHHRRLLIGPALSQRNLLHMESLLHAAGVGQLLAKWDKAIAAAGPAGRVRVCYFDDFLLMAFDVMTLLSFGQMRRSLTTGDHKIVNWVRHCVQLMFLQMVAPVICHRPFTWIFGRLYGQVGQFFAFGMSAIDSRKQLLASGAEKPKDILQSFIDAEDVDAKTRMTPSEVRTETILQLMAGADTSALTLCWTLHLLLLHPQCLRRVTDEVRAAFAAGHTITYEEAKEKLPYLEACLYESLRLRPVTSNLPRRVQTGGAYFQDHFIPGGYSCVVSLSAANMNTGAWDQPHVYDPERFLDKPDNKRKLLTFSTGVRICPGRHLAWLEVTTGLANVLGAYDIELPEDARFTPGRLDSKGQPVIMPGYHGITSFPRYPDRDCNAIISKRPSTCDK